MRIQETGMEMRAGYGNNEGGVEKSLYIVQLKSILIDIKLKRINILQSYVY